jgi:hypothetical protein
MPASVLTLIAIFKLAEVNRLSHTAFAEASSISKHG